ncbi:MAG: type IV secretion system protein [Acidobacteria bacterium]|nr:type IV secretion system protein [Acidobacteriota bacterium]
MRRNSCARSGTEASRRPLPLILAVAGILLLTAPPALAQPGTPNVNENNVGQLPQFVDTAINIVLSGAAQNTILGWGNGLARGIALILIVWTGARIALSGTFQAWELIKFILTLSLPVGLLQFYATPFAGGFSFPELITAQGNAITALFGTDILAQGMGTVMALARDHYNIVAEQAGSTNLWNAVTTGGRQVTHVALLAAILGSFVLGMVVVIALALAQVIFAKIAVAVLVTLGPIFIPFMIVPKMDFLFWGWFKAMLQYSLYSAIAAAMIGLWTRIIMGFSRGLSATDFTVQTMTAATGVWLVPVFGVIICAIVSILKIGDIAGMIVGAGSDGAGFVGGAFMAGRIVAAPARVAAAPLKGGLPA